VNGPGERMPENSIQQLLQLAGNFHQSGRLMDAERVYLQILQSEPRSAVALHGLSVVQFETGRGASALESMRRAAEADPKQPHYQYNLGIALKSAGRPAEAIGAFEQATRLNPNFAEAHNDLGIALAGVGRLDDAIASFRKAIAVRPDFPEAWNNLGNALGDQQRTGEAVEALTKALSLRPNYAEALSNLGNAFSILGRKEEAIAACRKAVEIRPDMAAGWNNLGHALCGADQPDEAADACRKALALRPSFPLACNNLGNALKDAGDVRGAIEKYRAAVALSPDYKDAHSNAVLAMLYCEDFTAPEIFREMRAWDQSHAARFSASIQTHTNDRNPDRRLRIGYISPDFRDHVVGRNLLPILQHHDHAKFEIFCYANHARDDEYTLQFRQTADAWRDIHRADDDSAARMIREDGIDILIDLAGHTSRNRLLVLARKPAPVQATFGGYPAGTGMKAIDYRISDPQLDPVGQTEAFYAEKIFRLPDSFWCYDPVAMGVAGLAGSPLPALSAGIVTFGCLNNFCKVTAGMLAIWAEVLAAVDGSRMLLIAPAGSARQRVLDKFRQGGVEASRVEFLGRLPSAEYFQQYHRIDIGLDTLPYNGHTTSLDAFWMGVPTVTLVGDSAPGRAGLSQLTNLKLTELAADSSERFVQIAAGLAADLPKLAALRAGLRDRMLNSPLTDADRFARNLEAAYRTMWTDWCVGGRA
jgi:protein O-GlcNAc transferase